MGLVCPGGAIDFDSRSSFSPQSAPEPPSPRQRRKRRALSDITDRPAFHPSLPRIVSELQSRATAGTQAGAAAVVGGPIARSVDLEGFVTHIVKYSVCSPSVWPVVLTLLRRLEDRTSVRITEDNVQRLFMAAYLCAVKSLDDRGLGNVGYSVIGSVSVSELTWLEGSFLTLLDWDVYVSAEEYADVAGDAAAAPEPAPAKNAVHFADSIVGSSVARRHAPRG